MVGAFVIFRYQDGFDETAVREIAESVRWKFEGMAGLRSKAFTFNAEKREVVNFYIWESEEAAKAFYDDGFRERVTRLYGVPPEIEFVQMATLVDNAAGT